MCTYVARSLHTRAPLVLMAPPQDGGTDLLGQWLEDANLDDLQDPEFAFDELLDNFLTSDGAPASEELGARRAFLVASDSGAGRAAAHSGPASLANQLQVTGPGRTPPGTPTCVRIICDSRCASSASPTSRGSHGSPFTAELRLKS